MAYAITFDLKQSELEEHYHGNSSNNAYSDIERVFKRHGLVKKQGSVYFGYELTEVQCVVAVQDLVQKYPWFSCCVKDIQMLQIVNNSDMSPAIEAALKLLKRNDF